MNPSYGSIILKDTSSSSLLSAVNFAAVKHRNQRRKDLFSTPYINHPIEVSNLLSLAGVQDIKVLIAGLLHDTVEDTETSFKEIEEIFGVSIRKMVEECTDDKKLDKVTRKKLQITHTKEISDEAKLVKLADKYSNLKDLGTSPPSKWSDAEIREYIYWSVCCLSWTRDP